MVPKMTMLTNRMIHGVAPEQESLSVFALNCKVKIKILNDV